jgi:signal transduction histidine kinase
MTITQRTKGPARVVPGGETATSARTASDHERPEIAVRPRSEQDRERLLALEKEARAAAEIAVHRISTLQAVTAALSEAVTLVQVADLIVGEGVASLGACCAALYLFDSGREDLELCAHRGIPADCMAVARRVGMLADSSVACAARTGEPIWVAGGESGAHPGGAAAIPLSVGGRVAGVVSLGFDASAPLPEEERVFALALVRHCAQAVDRARLYERERRSNRRLELLAKAGDLLSSSIDYDTTLDNVTRLALPALGDCCFFDVVEDDGVRRLAHTHADPEADALLATARWARGGCDGVIASAMASGRSELHPEAGEEIVEALVTDPEHLALLHRLALRSILVVPVVARDQTLGVITLCFGPSGRRHTVADVELGEELARRAAIAVENAMLHRACRDAMQRAQEANRRSEQANRTKDEFLGVVSHELRTPLNAVLGWSQLLRGQAASDPAVLAKGLRVIDRNARAQAKLIEDILDVSRIITGKLRLELRPLEVEGVLRSALDVIRPAADAKGVELCPTVEAGAMVSGDPDRLQQVVWNLVSNAVKFTPQGGRVEILLGRERGAAMLAVRDTGLGIDQKFLPYVFERFRQADSTLTRRHGGLGLGLAIVRHLVELHGGTVRAESGGPGSGSTFTVRLPLREDHHQEHESGPPAVRETDPGRRAAIRLDGLRVLVVDDEPDARELISTMLGACGAEVAVAGSAAEALASLGRFVPDVLVSDVGMPGEDGYALIRKVRSSGSDLARIPAVALTAYAGPEDARRAVLAGFHTHLSKPAEPAMLTAVVASLGGRITI